MAVIAVHTRTSAAGAQHAHGSEGTPMGRFAVFDLDRTLLPGSSLGPFAVALADAGLLRRRDLARHAAQQSMFAARGLGPRALERICAELVRTSAGHRRDDVVDVAISVAPQIVGRVYPAARWLLDEHAERGDRLVLLSAGPQELVAAIASLLTLHTALGTESEVIDGRYTGRLAGPFCHGQGKVTRLREVLGPVELRRTAAYGDSASDVPVLQAVRRPVAVNPDRRLEAIATRHRWPILKLG